MLVLVCYINVMMGRNLKENNFTYSSGIIVFLVR